MPSTTPKPVRAAAHVSGHTELGRRIAARREALGLTRQQVGSRCGVDAATSLTWRSGPGRPAAVHWYVSPTPSEPPSPNCPE